MTFRATDADGVNPVVVGSDLLLSAPGVDEIYARINSGGTTSFLRDARGQYDRTDGCKRRDDGQLQLRGIWEDGALRG